jgi:hypothetical protein
MRSTWVRTSGHSALLEGSGFGATATVMPLTSAGFRTDKHDMRPLRWTSALCRALIWCALCYWANYVVVNGAGNPTPPSDPSVALHGAAAFRGVAFFLVLTAPTGLLYLLAIRTWVGTVLAGTAFGVVLIGVLSSIANDQSSTAGIGIPGVPVVVLLPVAAVVIGELWTGTKRSNTPTA